MLRSCEAAPLPRWAGRRSGRERHATPAPAFAVSIKHSNRAGGDPESQSLPTGHAPPPVDDAPARPLDKSHETGGVR